MNKSVKISGLKPESPQRAIVGSCHKCGAKYDHADIGEDENGIAIFLCPQCKSNLENDELFTKSILRNNLQENFENPIKTLNDETQTMWQNTIRYAQYGFVARMILSVIAFLAGLVLFLISGWRLIFGNFNLEGLVSLLGTGISFISGLSTMYYVVVRSPLKEIRQSVSDLGIASAAFIAYIHQVLEISHTFSFYYLNGKISFDEMKKSNELIRKSMQATVKALYPYQSKDFEQVIQYVEQNTDKE